MRISLFFLMWLCSFFHWNCQNTATVNDELSNRDTVPLIPKSDTSTIEKNNGLIAFVGEKIEVIPLPSRGFDARFKAKYKVLQNVYGNYSKNIIEFEAYDHYGDPEFAKYKHVLLFVSEHDGKYYHEKYLFNDVYKTKSGRWAGRCSLGDYDHPHNFNTRIIPEIIEFAETVKVPVKKKFEDGTEATYILPAPYYEKRGDSAIAIYGNYLEDLFELKKSGVLTSRGLFDLTPEQEEAEVLARFSSDEPPPPPDADDLKLMAFWKVFAASVKEPGLKKFRRIALDSLSICDEVISTKDFIEICFKDVFDEEALYRIGTSTGKEYSWSEAKLLYMHSAAKKEIIKVKNTYRLRTVSVARSTRNNSPSEISFDFIETSKGYRLYGIDHHSFKECRKF